MKKIFTLLITFAVIISSMCCLSMSAYADYSIPSYLRIGLFYGGTAKTSVNLASVNGFYIGKYSGTVFEEKKRTNLTELTVTFSDDAITATNNGSVIYTATNLEDGLGIFPTVGGMERVLSIDGEKYRGGLDFKKINGKNVITNVVFMNNYLYGVISREMSPSWHKEALKAQAVCARNYAANNLGKHSEYGFDLCSSVCCQAYSGVRYETDNSYAPVDETSNQVLTYDGKLAQLYYCSSSGSRTEDVKNVWGNSVPYLVSVDNSYEDTANIPNGIWTGSITCDEATTIMRNKGYNVGQVTDIKVTEYSENGRVLKMEVTGTNGTKTFEREGCRTIFNTITKSQEFTVRGNGEAAQNVPTIRTTDGNSTSDMRVDEVVILSATGRSTLNALNLFATNGTYQQTYQITHSEATTNTGFIFEGTGWGHSVGMSQYGAKGMAEIGYDYIDILLHYFPGTNLENAY